VDEEGSVVRMRRAEVRRVEMEVASMVTEVCGEDRCEMGSGAG